MRRSPSSTRTSRRSRSGCSSRSTPRDSSTRKRSRPTRPIGRWITGVSCLSWSCPRTSRPTSAPAAGPSCRSTSTRPPCSRRASAPATSGTSSPTRSSSYLRRSENKPEPPVSVVVRKAYNPNGDTSWFTSIVAIINQITTLTMILTGAALIREREHGTIEHMLVMPLSAFEIALAKVWANGLVVLVAVTASLFLVVRTILAVPIAGSPGLFLAGVVLYLFFATALGDLPGHDHPVHGPVRPADHPADHRAPVAVRRKYAGREPARIGCSGSRWSSLRGTSSRSRRPSSTVVPAWRPCGLSSWPSPALGSCSSSSV